MTSISPCPICRKPMEPRFRPFCSSRCANLDLGRWLKESYVLPGDETVPDPVPDPEQDN